MIRSHLNFRRCTNKRNRDNNRNSVKRLRVKNYKVIIVDDHKMFPNGLLSILESKKEYEIVLTENSGKNVAKYLDINNSKEFIDLVITDVNMPDLNGIELNKHIKDNHPKTKTLVVYAT